MSNNLIKCPTPKNFKTGKVSLSLEEVSAVQSGDYDTLVIIKYGSNGEILLSKKINQKMIDSIEDKEEYALMSYR